MRGTRHRRDSTQATPSPERAAEPRPDPPGAHGIPAGRRRSRGRRRGDQRGHGRAPRIIGTGISQYNVDADGVHPAPARHEHGHAVGTVGQNCISRLLSGALDLRRLHSDDLFPAGML